MPRKTIVKVEIATEQPDCCQDCPLLGLVPKELIPPRSQESHLCIPTMHAMTARMSRSKRSEADKKHPRRRWCDDLWEVWRMVGFKDVSVDSYKNYREPLERKRAERNQPLQIIFHKKRGPKPKNEK